MPSVHYLEVVTHTLESTCSFYEELLNTSFGEPVADLGQARTAHAPDGTLIGIRKPLAEHESPIVRHYLQVDDIATAARAAQSQGATIAYPPTKQGEYGTFAIVIMDGVQHGLWQS